MNADSNTDIVKQSYAAFFQGDMDAMLALYSEDVDWEVYGPSSIPTTGLHRGKDGVRAFFGKVDDLLENESFEVQEHVAQGDTVVVLGEYSWRSKVTERVVHAHFAHVVTVTDGKITRFREYTDTAALVEAMVA